MDPFPLIMTYKMYLLYTKIYNYSITKPSINAWVALQSKDINVRFVSQNLCCIVSDEWARKSFNENASLTLNSPTLHILLEMT